MTTLSLGGKIARVTLFTGVTLVALILFATYASTLGMHGGGMMAWNERAWDDEIASSVSAPEASSSMMDSFAYGGGMPMMDAIESTSRVIKTGAIDMTSTNVPATVDAIGDLAIAKGGYVQSSSTSDDEIGKASSYVTVRVPADTFEDTMTAIKALGTHINNESVSGEDVTEQYTDLAARLTAAKAQEEQYLLILQDAETVGEVLAVQEHLGTVRAEIESLQGQINYLEDRTDLATISVTVTEETTAASASESKFEPSRDIDSALAFVITVGQGLISALIWIGIVGSAIGVPVGIAGLIYWFAVGRKKQGKKRR